MKNQHLFRTTVLSLAIFFATNVIVNAQRVKESGDIITVESDITGFDSISLSHQFEGDVVQSNSYGITIDIDSNLEKYLVIKKKGNTLHIGLKNNVKYKGERPVFELHMPELSGVDMSGATSIDIDRFDYDGEFEIDMSGASHVTGELNTTSLDINTSGASQIELSGKTEEITIEASGASDIDLDEMEAEDIDINFSGASNARFNLNGELTGDVSGVSSVKYAGKPSRVNVNSSGLSKIRSL